MRKFPTIAGIDMAGTVEASADARFKKGDKVIVHGYDMGVAHDGGYAEHVRVPADWVVRRPESMTAFDAMTLGTAGLHRGTRDRAHAAQRPHARQRARGRDRRDRRRRLGRDRDPGEARLPRRRDHRQGRGGELPEGHRRQGSRAAAVARPDQDPPARSRDLRRAPSTTWAATSCRGSCPRRRSAARSRRSGSRRATSSTPP